MSTTTTHQTHDATAQAAEPKPSSYGLGTLAVHAAQETADPATGARAVPIYAKTRRTPRGSSASRSSATSTRGS